MLHPLHDPRFASRIVVAPTACWIWCVNVTDQGYGYYHDKVTRKNRSAHRLIYESLRGPIPESMTLDHLCRVRRCVNPDHLEVVSNRENILRGVSVVAEDARKTHCKRDHPLSGENLKIYAHPTTGGRYRVCLACADRYNSMRRNAARRRCEGG